MLPSVPRIAISVPSGAHHRSFLQPIRDLVISETDWEVLVISPGAPWSDQLFPDAEYPRSRFRFVENTETERLFTDTRPSLVVTTTAGLDLKDPPILEAAQRLGLRTATFVESWDNIWKTERVARGLGKPGQRIVFPDALLVWNDRMKQHALRAFPTYKTDETYRTDRTYRTYRSPRIVITGAPRLDYFGPRYASQLPPRAEVMESLGLKPEGRLLHLATTELYDHGHVAKAIGEAKRRGDLPPDLQLYASVHPGGKMERHQPWAEKYGFSIRFSPGRRADVPHPDFRYNPTQEEMLRLAATFKEADVMVNLSSTVALESCLADRPTICAFFGKSFDWFAWRRSMVVRDFREHYADLLSGGGIAVARNGAQLVAQIRAYLEDPQKDSAGRRRSAEIIAGTVAGDASERVLAKLKTLAASS